MSVPPSGGWQPPQQPGQPPYQGQPYGQSGYDPQQPPPGWQQGGWQQPPGPPPQKGSSLKWLLIGVAVLLVIGISVGATLIFTGGSGGGGTPASTSDAPSALASANDTGPINIVTNEPTCGTFVGINNSLGDVQDQGWGAQRGTLGSVATWTADQRKQVEEVAKATRKATEEAESLARLTPHRVVRELYEQFIYFSRAYVDSVPSYEPSNNELASAGINASSAIIGICNSITYGSSGRSVSTDPGPTPTNRSDLGDPANPKSFVGKPGEACTLWEQASKKFDLDTADWQSRDTSIPAIQWTPEQRAIEDTARPVIEAFADTMEGIGRQSANGAFEDFSTAAALYLRASTSAGDNYVSADSWLSFTAFRFNLLISSACHVAE